MPTPNTQQLKPTIWVLADDRAGNRAQALGVAEKLGLPFEIKEIRYNLLAGLPNLLLGNDFRGLDTKKSSPLAAQWPQMVIAAGRRTAPIARAIKKRSPQTYLVQIMWPGYPPPINPLNDLTATSEFDLIVLPSHDRYEMLDNVIQYPLSPHRITHEKLREAAVNWAAKFAHLPKPWVAVLVGGNSKQARFEKADFVALAKAANALAGSGSLLITTSRRTGKAGEEALKSALTAPHFFYGYTPESTANPYLGILGAADAVIATGDSMSMSSEACFTGKPLFIYANDRISTKKHQRLHAELYKVGAAKPLADELAFFTPAHLPDTAIEVATYLRHRLEAFQKTV